MYTSVCVHLCVHKCVCTLVCTSVCVHLCVHKCVCVCVCVCVCTLVQYVNWFLVCFVAQYLHLWVYSFFFIYSWEAPQVLTLCVHMYVCATTCSSCMYIYKHSDCLFCLQQLFYKYTSLLLLSVHVCASLFYLLDLFLGRTLSTLFTRRVGSRSLLYVLSYVYVRVCRVCDILYHLIFTHLC